MAKDGIHAVLMVFCATSRFSREDSSTIETIKELFGEKIVDHMILVFTYGDLVGETKLNSMLTNAPDYLQKSIELCKNRVVLFDNMTKDRRLQVNQLDKLLHVVDSANSNNGGKLFSDQMRTGIKEAHAREHEVEEKLNITVDKLQEQLMEEQDARLEAERLAAEARLQSDKDIRKLKKHLGKENEAFEMMIEKIKGWKVINNQISSSYLDVLARPQREV
uniref:AIG1-type G domain-containing protein n=1 Tax=Oryza punctata TaxID=4537 RepID=A0A0E0K150_ORYPU